MLVVDENDYDIFDCFYDFNFFFLYKFNNVFLLDCD